MVITKYSIIMSIMWFMAALLVGSFLIVNTRRIAWRLILLIFLLGFLRLILPVELKFAKEVLDWKFYPVLQRVLETEVFHGITVAAVLWGIWGVGSVIQFMKFVYRIRQRNQIVLRARTLQPGEEVYKVSRSVIRQNGYKGKFRVAVTTEFSTAVSVGILSPVILIPVEMLDFEQTELAGIIKHEFIHYLQKDVAIQWGVNLLQCIFWWNPAVNVLQKSVGQMMELRCDARVCENMDDRERIAYLQGILHVLRSGMKETPEVGVGYVKDKSGVFLQRRFHEVLEPVKKQSSGVTVGLVGLCVVVFLLSYTFVIQPAARPAESGAYSLNQSEPADSAEEREFLIELSDGTYLYYLDMKEIGILTEQEINQPEYVDLPIYKSGEGE